jgi:hypothetical protein
VISRLRTVMITAKAITVSRVFNILLVPIFYRFERRLTRQNPATSFDSMLPSRHHSFCFKR